MDTGHPIQREEWL